MRKTSHPPKQNTLKDSPRKLERLRNRLAAEQRLLSLHNSPFPDPWERRKRKEIYAEILDVQRQIRELISIPNGNDGLEHTGVSSKENFRAPLLPSVSKKNL